MNPTITAVEAHACDRCTKPILPGRALVWIGATDELVHPGCLDEAEELS